MKVGAVTQVPAGGREGGQAGCEGPWGRAPGLTGAGLPGWPRRLSTCHTGPGGLPGPLRPGPDPGEPWGQACCPGVMGPSGHLGGCQAGPCRPRTASGCRTWGTKAAARGSRAYGTGGPGVGCRTGAWGLGEARGQGSGCRGPGGWHQALQIQPNAEAQLLAPCGCLLGAGRWGL